MPVQYRVDLAETGRPFPHYWELCIGSCHAALILRADMQEHMRKQAAEPGMSDIFGLHMLAEAAPICEMFPFR